MKKISHEIKPKSGSLQEFFGKNCVIDVLFTIAKWKDFGEYFEVTSVDIEKVDYYAEHLSESETLGWEKIPGNIDSVLQEYCIEYLNFDRQDLIKQASDSWKSFEAESRMEQMRESREDNT